MRLNGNTRISKFCYPMAVLFQITNSHELGGRLNLTTRVWYFFRLTAMKFIKACCFSFLLVSASIICAQELYDFDNLDSVATKLPGAAELGTQQIPAPLSTAITVTAASSAIRQTSGYEGIFPHVSKEYSKECSKECSDKQQSTILREKIKNIPGATSNFSLRYSRDDDRASLEYRFSENGALRLRGLHKGVKIVATWKY